MTFTLPRLAQQRRTGSEPFHADGTPLPFDLLSFWQWSASRITIEIKLAAVNRAAAR